MAGTDGLDGKKFDLQTLQQVMYGDRHLGGEMARDELVAACRASGKPNLQTACAALAGWDLKVNLDSRGAHRFHLFAEHGGLKWKVPFDPADPVRTPNTLDTANPAVLAALRVPTDSCVTSPASLNARRCCDTAGRVTGSRPAMSPTERGPSASISKIARRIGSASTAIRSAA